MADEKQLTEVQSKILEAIVSYRREKGYNPTMREVGEAVGLSSTSSVSYQLSQLRELGFLSKADAGQRAMDVLKSAPGMSTALLRSRCTSSLAGMVALSKYLGSGQTRTVVPWRRSPSPALRSGEVAAPKAASPTAAAPEPIAAAPLFPAEPIA